MQISIRGVAWAWPPIQGLLRNFVIVVFKEQRKEEKLHAWLKPKPQLPSRLGGTCRAMAEPEAAEA